MHLGIIGYGHRWTTNFQQRGENLHWNECLMLFSEHLQLPCNCDGDDGANGVPVELSHQTLKPILREHNIINKKIVLSYSLKDSGKISP